MLPLMDKNLERKLPPLYATDGQKIKTIYARYYLYDWEWFVIEYSPIQRLFFGLVDGLEREYGYFTLDELIAVGAKRDYTFEPITIQGDYYGKRVA